MYVNYMFPIPDLVVSVFRGRCPRSCIFIEWPKGWFSLLGKFEEISKHTNKICTPMTQGHLDFLINVGILRNQDAVSRLGNVFRDFCTADVTSLPLCSIDRGPKAHTF